MKYIIMSAGKGTRWNHYMNTTKQLVDIYGENLLERTIRLLHENEIYDIIISSYDKNHSMNNILRIESKEKDYISRMFVFDYLNEPTTFLYGDVFYSDDAIRKIIDEKTSDVKFFGNEKTFIAIKVENVDFFKARLKNCLNDDFYYYCFKEKNNDRFCYVESEFYNINTADDYHNLLKIIRKKR